MHIFEGMQCDYHGYYFVGLHDEKELEFNESVNYKKTKYYKKYKNILFGKIKRPNMPGFMLKELLFNDEHKICHFTAWVGKYAENVYTSHILEYELFVLYKKYKIFTPEIYEKIKNELTIRNKIHENKSIIDILSTGCNRASLLGVQLLVLLKDGKEYRIVIFKRSHDVAAKPDYYQFIPSGGFEVHDNQNKHLEEDKEYKEYKEYIQNNFSVTDAIFREFAEELFDHTELQGEKPFKEEGSRKIRRDNEVQKITDMIDKGSAKFEFLGSVVNFIDLRNELSFILRIDDENYSRIVHFNSNNEGKKVLIRSINEVENIFKSKKVNPGSAGLWYLAQKNHLFKEITERG